MTEVGRNGSYERVALSDHLVIELSWHAITDTGLRRENNQDSYTVVPPIFAVADGMGGHTAGEIASDAVATRLSELQDLQDLTPEHIDRVLRESVFDIQERVGETDLGAGTTVTGLALVKNDDRASWLVLNIGDSRVYQFFRGSLSQVTTDHSVVQHLIDTGAITPEEAETHPHANVITRAVGFNEEPIPDYTELALIPGQRMLICSDGLTKELTDFGIRHFLSTARTAKDAAEELLQQALQNSGRDNVTVVVIDVHAVGDMRETGDLSRTRLPLNDPSDTEEVPRI
ncbi:PP2C family protein-serine/threonine phosphatase [Leucobacter chinensis]|uniref:PP2C family protein-serine/threonine phosphatase n=1 Tax=Leucobacter chinensis TaxID=2851010 RepID=UPI001C22A02F|nr:protein phosphatase 2C domain-containing protein [Leucobacter chinensis]